MNAKRASRVHVAAVAAGAVMLAATAGWSEEESDVGRALTSAAPSADERFEATVRPDVPEAQHPPMSTPQNVDTNKPVHEWQRLTDDWGGLRPTLDDHGVSINASVTSLFAKSLSGGRETRIWASDLLVDVTLTLDLQKMAHLQGATVFASFQNESSTEQSPDGAILETSDAVTPERTQLSEWWYEQKLMDDLFRIKVGKIDAESEFSTIEAAEEFLNGTMQHSPTIVGFPTHPDPAVGLILAARPVEHLYAQFGLFDGGAGGGMAGNHAPRIFTHASNLFMIGEAGAMWDLGGRREGKLGVGLWHLTGDVMRLDGTKASGATGPYLFAEQTFWRTAPEAGDDDRGIAAWVMYGHASPQISTVEHHAAGGLTWRGPIPSRDDDVLGAGVTWADLGHGNFSQAHEWALEGFYRIQLTKFFSVKPDLQYVRHPGGNDGRDAVVFTLQMIMDF